MSQLVEVRLNLLILFLSHLSCQIFRQIFVVQGFYKLIRFLIEELFLLFTHSLHNFIIKQFKMH